MSLLTKYELTTAPGVYDVYKFGVVDTRNLTDVKAAILFKQGFPYLKECSAKKQTTTRKKGSTGKVKKIKPHASLTEQS